MNARNLRAADRMSGSSDSYCKITLPDDKVMETKPILSTNPIWNQKFPVKIKINKYEAELKDIKFHFFDYDTGASDDELAWVYVNAKKCFENPGKWAINEIFKLDGDLVIK